VDYKENKAQTTTARKELKSIFVNGLICVFNTAKCCKVLWFIINKTVEWLETHCSIFSFFRIKK